MNGLRIGVLGAAKITPNAVIRPANAMSRAAVVAIAARDRRRAAEFASKHAIPTVHDTYEELVADPNVDAIYNPLPNGLHGRWTLASIEAGKHVLCEKPFTANAAEAETVAVAADASGLVVMEAFHWRYHPLADADPRARRGGRDRRDHVGPRIDLLPVGESRRHPLAARSRRRSDDGCGLLRRPHVATSRGW